jgi:hypothetical protein
MARVSEQMLSQGTHLMTRWMRIRIRNTASWDTRTGAQWVNLTWIEVEAVRIQIREDGQSLGADAGAGYTFDDQVADKGRIVLPHDWLKSAPERPADWPLRTRPYFLYWIPQQQQNDGQRCYRCSHCENIQCFGSIHFVLLLLGFGSINYFFLVRILWTLSVPLFRHKTL